MILTFPGRVKIFIKDHGLLLILLLFAFLIRLFMANADPFLHPWDERFHALVARNMMHHPFKPMLRAFPVTDHYDRFAWCCNHIWLHKQPLFMWQMALSMKIFGVSELAMRLPSVIMGTIMIALLYRIAFLFSNHNKMIALIAAALLAFSNFHLQLIAGMHGMDHNDVATEFYVLASIWAYAEYTRDQRWRWLPLIGLFAGCAILNKWLLGLLVFSGWGVNLLIHIRDKGSLKSIAHFAVALICCCIVFIPWQLYTLHVFPENAKYVFEFNRRHLTEVIEGNGGSVFYYLEKLPVLFGAYIYPLIFIGGLLSLFSRQHNRQLHVVFIVEIIVAFCFFSFIVKPKIDTYFFLVAPLCMLFSAFALFALFRLLKKSYLIVPVMALVLYFTLDPLQIKGYLSPDNTERNDRIYNADIYRNLKSGLPDSVRVVMNMNSFEDIDVMFYNNDLTAYHWTLPEADLQELKQKKIPIAVFEDHGNYILPDSVLSYPYLFIIPKKLKDF